jgi:hypothetical protein
VLRALHGTQAAWEITEHLLADDIAEIEGQLAGLLIQAERV